MEETRIMWTRQAPEVWEELQKKGYYHVKKEYIQLKNDTLTDYYLKLYEWYTKEARKHMAIPETLEYPIWLSMDKAYMLQPVEDTVILEVEIPRSEYIICNMDNWGYRVNYWYIPLDEKDHNKHGEELERYGIKGEDDLILTAKGNFYPALRRKIIDSWERVFTIPPKRPADAAATVWELKYEWVKEVLVNGEAAKPDHVDRAE